MIRVGIVDDHAVVRAGLAELLACEDDIEVVGQAASGRGAIDLVRRTPLDVLILDLAMPEQSGMDALAMVRAKAPGAGILILSGYAEEQYAVNLLRQGVSGYLNKACEPGEIVDAVRTIGRGKRYISREVANLLATQLDRPTHGAPHETLSERELQVFLRLARGERPGEIARGLSLSLKTVSTYRSRIMGKLGLSSNGDLTYYAVKNRLIE